MTQVGYYVPKPIGLGSNSLCQIGTTVQCTSTEDQVQLAPRSTSTSSLSSAAASFVLTTSKCNLNRKSFWGSLINITVSNNSRNNNRLPRLRSVHLLDTSRFIGGVLPSQRYLGRYLLTTSWNNNHRGVKYLDKGCRRCDTTGRQCHKIFSLEIVGCSSLIWYLLYCYKLW